MFWSDKDLFLASTHQSPLYPGTGALNETGVAANICNAPLRPGDGGGPFREAMESRVLPALRNFSPDLILISAGFDAHGADDMSHLRFTTANYAGATEVACGIADRHAQGRIVSTLEGGYDLRSLAASAAAHIEKLVFA